MAQDEKPGTPSSKNGAPPKRRRERDRTTKNPTTLAQREIQAMLDAGEIGSMPTLRRTLAQGYKLTLVSVGQRSKKTGKRIAKVEARDGRRIRLYLSFGSDAEGGRRRAFKPFDYEPVAPVWYVYGLFVGRRLIEGAFVGVTDEPSRTLYEAERRGVLRQPCPHP